MFSSNLPYNTLLCAWQWGTTPPIHLHCPSPCHHIHLPQLISTPPSFATAAASDRIPFTCSCSGDIAPCITLHHAGELSPGRHCSYFLERIIITADVNNILQILQIMPKQNEHKKKNANKERTRPRLSRDAKKTQYVPLDRACSLLIVCTDHLPVGVLQKQKL
jgi:hypothetical protein